MKMKMDVTVEHIQLYGEKTNSGLYVEYFPIGDVQTKITLEDDTSSITFYVDKNEPIEYVEKQ